MELTREQLLEMTETIARACGWKPLNDGVFVHLENTEDFMGNLESFEPFISWDDAMKAEDAMKIGPLHFIPKVKNMERCWLAGLGHYPYGYQGEHAGRLTAFFLALHEAAKAKLEGCQNEYGN